MAKICRYCGAQNDDSMVLCFTCGSPLAAQAAPQNNPAANMNAYMPQQGIQAGGYANAQQQGARAGGYASASQQGTRAGGYASAPKQGARAGAYSNASQQGSQGGAYANAMKQGSLGGAYANASQQGAQGGAYANASQQGTLGGAYANASQQGTLGGAYANAQQQGGQAGDFANTPLQGIQGGAYANTPQQSYQDSDTEITSESTVTIVDPDEMVVATLRNGVLLNVISGEGIKNEEAFVTNKRVYVNTTTGLLNRNRVEAKIDLQDVSATRITFLNPFGLIVVAVLAVLAGIVVFAEMEEAAVLVVALVLAAIFVIIFFVIRKRYMRIDHAGGSIRFSVKKYSAASVRGFQRAIHREKENLESKQ